MLGRTVTAVDEAHYSYVKIVFDRYDDQPYNWALEVTARPSTVHVRLTAGHTTEQAWIRITRPDGTERVGWDKSAVAGWHDSLNSLPDSDPRRNRWHVKNSPPPEAIMEMFLRLFETPYMPPEVTDLDDLLLDEE